MHPDTIFHLIPRNDAARGVLTHPDNAAFVSMCAALPRQDHTDNTTNNTCSNALEIGPHVPRQPCPRIIARIGRDADLILPDSSVSSLQFSFEVNYDTRTIILYDRSRHCNTTLAPVGFRANEGLHQQVLQPGKTYEIGAGGQDGQLYLFEVRWVSDVDAVELALKGHRSAMERPQNPRFARTTEGGPLDLAARYGLRTPTAAKWGVQRTQKERLLGTGAYGEVWEAIDLDTGNRVAVKKVVSNDTRQDRENVLWREVEHLAEIKHENIVRFLGSTGWGTGTVEIHMSLKEGNLNDMLQRFPGAISSSTIFSSLLPQMLKALDYLACRNLCHRDVKPDNILYTVVDGGGYHFHLADFGLANRKNMARTLCGSPMFMAPEVRYGMSQTPKVDIWSLFVTLVSITRPATFSGRDMSYEANLELIRTAAVEVAVDNPIIALMATEDPTLRPSAAQLLVHLFNGEGLTTPRRRVGRIQNVQPS